MSGLAGAARTDDVSGTAATGANTARAAGSFRFGGITTVNKLGFGAMRVTGPGVWGEPVDRAEAVRTLERLGNLGADFIDIADRCGPGVPETLLREVLHP